MNSKPEKGRVLVAICHCPGLVEVARNLSDGRRNVKAWPPAGGFQRGPLTASCAAFPPALPLPRDGTAAATRPWPTRDIKRFASTILALAATSFLAACNEEAACTRETATRKATDLSTKIQELATSDPTKVAELAPKLQDLATKAAAGGDDLAATCTALDEMMAELSK